jgi:SPASM domain peptide maturase of grasp-with-spasm system
MSNISFDKPYVLSADCLLTRGFSRTVLCDTAYGSYIFIPDALAEILQAHTTETIEETIRQYGAGDADQEEAIREYFLFLIKHDMIFNSALADQYPRISLDWDQPSEITNAIVDVAAHSMHDYALLFRQLSDLLCHCVQIRIFRTMPLSELEHLLELTDGTFINSVEIVMPNLPEVSKENWLAFVRKHIAVKFIQLYGADRYETLVDATESRGFVHLVKNDLTSEKCCGVVLPVYLTPNLLTITESQKHNSCLNRKIAIDADGEIRNCPSLPQSFGNLRDTTLRAALAQAGFKKYWNITKDQVAVCRDCEFRHICTDCRAYVEEPGNAYSKPLKCGYDPYSCEWEDWSTHPLKQAAIDTYGLREVLPEFEQVKI